MMTVEVKCGEIDRDNQPVGETQTLGLFESRGAAERFIADKIARFDHSGFVPDGHQAAGGGATTATRSKSFISGSTTRRMTRSASP